MDYAYQLSNTCQYFVTFSEENLRRKAKQDEESDCLILITAVVCPLPGVFGKLNLGS